MINIIDAASFELIRRIGPDKGGHWKIMTEENEAK